MQLIILLIALLCCSTVHAVDVYKCKGPSGETSFSNVPCPGNTVSAPHTTFVREKDAPSFTEKEAGKLISDVHQDPNLPVESRDAEPDRRFVYGYRCEAGPRVWVQDTPCPATAFSSQAASFNGVDVISGNPVSGTTIHRQKHDVTQTTLSRSDMCEHIKQQASKPAGRKAASDTSYERNNQRQKAGC